MYSTISNVVPAFKIVEKTKQMINKDPMSIAATKNVLQRDPMSGATMKQNISGLIGLVLFIGAIYLSWTCNTRCSPNMNAFEKVIRAIFAGMFSFIYLIIYLIAWSAQCNAC
jgi:hypothetical protein